MTDRTTAPTKLLLRRPMHPDEWGESYLADLIRLNGLRKIWGYHVDQVRSNLGGYTSSARSVHCIDKLPLQRAPDGRPQYGTLGLPRWASLHRSTATRYCPVCMAESRYIRTRWRIPLLPVCTFHGCYLKNDLAEPALTTQYKHSNYRYIHEVTDEQLMEEAVCCLPAEFAAVSAVWAPLERAASTRIDPSPDESLGELAGWTVLAWRLLEWVAREHCRQVRQQSSSGMLADIAQMMADARVTIAPNQQGVQAFLQGLNDNAQRRAAARCLSTIRITEARTVTVLSRLPLEQLHDGLLAAAPQMTVNTEPTERRFREEHSHALTRQQAIDYLGVGGKLVNDWIRKRRFLNVTVRKVGRKHFIFIDRSDLKRARRYLLSLVYVEDFLSEQGVDWSVYFALRKQGILEPVQWGGRSYLGRDDVAALACRLELMSQPAAENEGLVYPLFSESTIVLGGRQETYGAFVNAALDGQFAVYRRLDLPGLSSFQVGPEALAWIRTRRAVDRARTHVHRSSAQIDLLESST